MNLIYTAAILALLAALLHWFVGGIAHPWDKAIIVCIAALFIIGLLIVLGALPNLGLGRV